MPILKYKWTLLLALYLNLTFISGLYIEVINPPERDVLLFKIRPEQPAFVLFDDPEIDHSELKRLPNLVVIPVNRREKGLNMPVMTQRAELILEDFGFSQFHVIGEGVYGPAAIHFTTRNQDRIKSLHLIDANGIPEVELLGGYNLNHAIYGAQYSFWLALKYGIPHFGGLNSLNDTILATRIKFDTDQTKIRELISELEIPVQIFHSDKARVPVEVTTEFLRIIPQSTLTAELTLQNIADFVIASINDVAQSRSEASEERIEESLKAFDVGNAVKAEGKALLILMLIIILSTFVTEDLTCIGTGLMIARGLIGFYPGVLACLIGIFVGDILVYLSGRWLASSTLHKAPMKWFISERDIQKSYVWFEAKGPAIIIASRFIPGSRFPTYFSAGAIGASFGMFILYFGVASLLWTPVLVGISVMLGNQMMNYFSLYQDYALWVLLGVLTFLWVVFKIVIPSFTFKGRRLLCGKWKRLTNWEFWPPYVVYTPVFLYIMFLWVKHKSVTLFAACNPGMKDGGFIKESKSDILEGIKAGEVVTSFLTVDANDEQAIENIQLFMSVQNIQFPVVMKPDIGERGRGVSIVCSQNELITKLEEIKGKYLIQKYVDGEEFGIFYYRYPSQQNGKIFSITTKKYLNLTGDGEHTLEHLILEDPRAVCLAEYHIDHHINDLYHIPEEGEIVKLVEIGTHSRGSLFFDGNDLITDELTARMDEISKSYEGFYFGRYDIKVPSVEDLKTGKNISVIELNGVTSESTNIYDPQHSFFYGVKTLCKQWKIAYEIGEEYKAENPDLELPSVTYLLSQLS